MQNYHQKYVNSTLNHITKEFSYLKIHDHDTVKIY